MKSKSTSYRRPALHEQGAQLTYQGRNLDEIAFPLGGIGAGTVALGGWGQLRDWEIRNRPAKGYAVPEAFFTIRTQVGQEEPCIRLLQGPAGGGYVGDGQDGSRGPGGGLPRFRRVSFTGEFPLAQVKLSDPDLPVEVTLEAFNPFIPLNDKDSSLPAAVLLYRVKNVTRRPVKARLFGNLTNIIGPAGRPGRVNRMRRAGGLTGLVLEHSKLSAKSPAYGSLALATPSPRAAVLPRWRDRGLTGFWQDIALGNTFPPKAKGTSDTGTLGVACTIKPGRTVTVPFLITWHFPNFEHGHPLRKGARPPTWRNYYATQWSDAWAVARYLARNLDRLTDQTRLFHDTLFASTLPSYVLDAVSSQLSVLKTPTCLRLEDGTFYGFEGCCNTFGCCEGSCLHVWNYAQALPCLFPKLQQSMDRAHYQNCLRNDGFMQFRIVLPLGTPSDFDFHPAADGQMGLVMQVYREWRVSGDEEWLREMWPLARKALEFAWKYWDADRDGVMEGMQHNTYDIEFYGPNTMIGSLYLGALRAGEEMARALGETKRADTYRRIFEKGSKWIDAHLWNGEYYEQKVRPEAHQAWPDHYRHMSENHGKDSRFRQWPKWQYGKGCVSDQMIGQWIAGMLELGYLFNPRRVRRTLRSIFQHNWRSDLWGHSCQERVFAWQDDAGLLLGTWPKGGRPGDPFPFCDEVWCGIEYQVAAHLIMEGFRDEGLAIVKGVRDRHRGDRRNPWDEFECGHHYARSMASYSLLAALAGFAYSAPEARITFGPRLYEKKFRAFFSVGSGWGSISQTLAGRQKRFRVQLAQGKLKLATLDLAFDELRPRVYRGATTVTKKSVRPIVWAMLGGRRVSAAVAPHQGGSAHFACREPRGRTAGHQQRATARVTLGAPVVVKPEQELTITLR